MNFENGAESPSKLKTTHAPKEAIIYDNADPQSENKVLLQNEGN